MSGPNNRYDKLPKQIADLAIARDAAQTQAEKEKYNAQIMGLFSEMYDDRYSEKSDIALRADMPLMTKHVKIHENHIKANEDKRHLKERKILQDTKRLRDDTRKNEITDTSLVGYLQQMFVRNTDDYVVWNTDRLYALQDPLVSAPGYEQEQADIVDALEFDLSMISDTQLQKLFSELTSHTWYPTDEHGFAGNAPKYRNEAVYHIDELKDVLKTAKPIKLNKNEKSYKLLLVTQGRGTGKILEFRYNKFLNNDKHHDRSVSLNVYADRHECREKIKGDIGALLAKKDALRVIHKNYAGIYINNQTKEDKDFWKNKVEILQELLDAEYSGVFVQEAQYRAKKAIGNDKYMSGHTYKITMYGLLNKIELAIQELDAIVSRYRQYIGEEKK